MKTQVTIPIPDNPCHVQNLASIELLDAHGFEGIDASLNESLFEYGLIWRDLPETNELLFVYRHPSIPDRFDRVSIKKVTDVQKEWNWVKYPDLMQFIGADLEQWLALPLSHKVSDLISYYGTEEIFGTSYWEGFTISED